MSVTQTKFQCLATDLASKKHNWGSDTLKVLLTNVAPNASANAVKADITEIAAGNGYTAGGIAIPATAVTNVSGTAKLTGNNVTITASGGSIGPFRYVVLYNPTYAGGPLISFGDHGNSVTLNDTENFTVDLNSVAGDIIEIT